MTSKNETSKIITVPSLTVIPATPGYGVIMAHTAEPWPVVAWRIKHESEYVDVIPVTINNELNYLIEARNTHAIGDPVGRWSFCDGERVNSMAEALEQLRKEEKEMNRIDAAIDD